MASLLPIPTILQIGDIAQYLAANDASQGKKLKSGFLAPALAVQIFLAKTVVRWIYNLNPSDASLPQTSNYLFQLLGGYVAQAQSIISNVAGGIATITSPANVAILVGQNATFSVTVTSASPYTIAWYRNGVLIPLATGLSYTLSNAQLSDTGATFYAVATNSTGPIASNVAVLTVTTTITGYLFYSSSDPGPTLRANTDPFSYQINYSITHNQPINIPLNAAAANNQFLVGKVPIGESVKTIWFSSVLNNGSIPDFVFAPMVSFGGFDYYYTLQLGSYDPTVPLVLS
jgi:hypothetical protein